jgi:hypothetical protein
VRAVRILHLEDEFEVMNWIPSALRNYIWLSHPEWFPGDPELHEDMAGRLVWFEMSLPSAPTLVQYCAYTTSDELADVAGKPTDAALTIVLLDVFTVIEGRLVNDANEAFKAARIAAPASAVLFISAYTTEIPKDILDQIPPQNVFSKPVDSDLLLGLLTTLLQLT